MNRASALFLVAVFAFALVMAAWSLTEMERVVGTASVRAGTGGQPRDLDERLIRRQIREGRLSDHEAEFYKKSPALSGAPPTGEGRR